MSDLSALEAMLTYCAEEIAKFNKPCAFVIQAAILSLQLPCSQEKGSGEPKNASPRIKL